ncbi:ATP-binding cassette domain-containing protein [Streptomyces sp. NPDC007940]|uniref:ATP-binding cassette domain-containing protein n=1 Tax=Streptomyces sp. NPDC007940 TaxID=3364796 RepID=UPI0036EB61C2
MAFVRTPPPWRASTAVQEPRFSRRPRRGRVGAGRGGCGRRPWRVESSRPARRGRGGGPRRRGAGRRRGVGRRRGRPGPTGRPAAPARTRPRTPHEGEVVVRARGLRKSFGPETALDGVDLDVHPGEVVAVIGPSGSGRTTLVRTLNHLEQPDQGSVEIDGRLMGGKDRELAWGRGT